MKSARTVALIALALALLVPIAARADQTWLVVGDVHLDPYDASQRPSRPGSDSNLALFESALAEMKRAVPQADVVLIPGDQLAHGFARLVNVHDAGSSPVGAGLRTIQGIAGRFARTYPKAQFAVVLGNNDDPCGDYRSELGGPYLRALAKAWAPLVDRHGSAPQFAQTFAEGGNSVVELPGGRLRLVGINSVFFSKEYQGDCKGARPGAASRELAWLRSALASTPAGRRNVLLMHVPPGYDAFATELARGVVAWPYFGDEANAGLVAANASRIAFGVTGHGHRFDFRLLPAEPQPVPFFTFGALSPVYRNNPTFAVVGVTPDGAVRDITFHNFDERAAKWLPGQSFVAAWKPGAAAIDAATLAALHRSLGEDARLRATWSDQSIAGSEQNSRPLWEAGWRIAWCAQTELAATYQPCAGTGDPVAWLRAAMAVVPALVLTVVLVVLLRRRIQS